MARKFLMSWEGEPYFRWVKMHKGVRYRIGCKDLGAAVFTRDGSYQLANEWWRQKLAEIDAPRRKLLDRLEAKAEEVARIDAEVAMQLLGQEFGERLTDDEARERAVKKVRQVSARINAALSEPVHADFALSTQVERFLAVERARGAKPGTYGDVAYYSRKIGQCPSLNAGDVRTITTGTVTDYYAWLRRSEESPVVQRKRWNYFRRFVRFLWADGVLEGLPRNLDLKTFSFRVTARKIKTYSAEQVRGLLGGLPPRLRLYALLALNCGMYGVDMARLRRDELIRVSATEARIRRKRTKTEDQKNVPEVEYLLWPETLASLDRYPPTHEEFVLTSKTGTPLWTNEIRGGEKAKKDLIGLQWRRGRLKGRATKPSIPLKALRSVSASVLESHREYGRYKSHFLGHSPETLADRHYAAPSQELFDQAVMWLRTQLLGERVDSVPLGG